MFTNSSANIIRSISAFMRWQLGVITILLAACGQGAEHKEGNGEKGYATSAAYDNTLPVGIVKDTIVCKNEATQSYALYLPKDYTSKKAWPCIIFFDAHARGALPLRMYKDIAEKYGFILIGSNTSKNGTALEVTGEIISTLWKDVHQRLNIDSDRTYTSGFSGGSKVASLAAMRYSGITGVIGCAGSLPITGKEPHPNFEYFGIAGDYDFNLPEMLQLDGNLEQRKQPHFLLTWPGVHAWAPAEAFRTGVLWMTVNNMKAHQIDRNDAVIADLMMDLNKRISEAILKNDEITAARLLSGTVTVLEGLTDVTGYKKQLAALTNGGTYPYSLKAMQQLLQKEQAQCQEMAGQFTAQNEQWWLDKIAAINQQASHTKMIQEANSNRRVLAFLGFISYMNVSRAISTGDMAHAISYLNIFKKADPKNPDCSYFAALVCVKSKDTKGAMILLNDAVALGYSDVDQLTAEPAFASLLNDADFRKIVTMVSENHDGKNIKN